MQGQGTHHSDWNCWRIGKYELDFLKLLSSAPVLCETDPSCTTVTEAVSHDDGCGVLFDGGDDEGWLWRHLDLL